MTELDDLWRLEEQFWLGGADFYESTLAPDALMVLPDPIGVLDRAATITSIRSAARWRTVTFRERHQANPTADAAVLVYLAEADRGGPDSRYAARCGSLYVRGHGGWTLALHQQTPAP